MRRERLEKNQSLHATERTRLLRPYSRISWKKRARNMRMITIAGRGLLERRKSGEEDEGAFGGGSLAREEEG